MPSGAALAVRILDQLLDAVALAYGFAHGSAFAGDTLRALVLYALLLALTYALVARLEHGGGGGAGSTQRAGPVQGAQRAHSGELARACVQTTVVVQRYATYALAAVLRARASTFFVHAELGVHALSAPIVVVLIVSAAAALVEHFRVAPHVQGVRAPLSVVERFVDAVAFSYGLGGALRGRLLESTLWLAVVLLACAVARQHWVEADAKRRGSAAAMTTTIFIGYTVNFVEQYAFYVVARLISASALVQATTSPHGAPLVALSRAALADNAVLGALVVFVVAGIALCDALCATAARPVAAPGGDGSALARTGRGLVERFVDAVVVTAAFAHAAVFARALNSSGVLAALAALLAGAYVLEARARSETARAGASVALWRAVAALAALASRYSTYAVVQTLIGRGITVSAVRSGTPLALLGACALPLALAALLVVIRRTLEHTEAALAAVRPAAAAVGAPTVTAPAPDFSTAVIECEAMLEWNES